MAAPTLYFAYGSNLHAADLAALCRRRGLVYPLGAPVARAYLPNLELVFPHFSSARRGGVLSLRPRPGQVAPGVLFDVAPGGWDTLDAKEGVAAGAYRRLPVLALTEDGRELPALTYAVCSPGAFTPPSADYLEVVRQGWREYGLHEAWLAFPAGNRPAPWYVDRLFVYGTLMRGECRHAHMDVGEVRFLGEAQAAGTLLDLGEYPGLLPPAAAASQVSGELYQLADPAGLLPRLDRVEGFAGFGRPESWFRRGLLRVAAADSRPLAWVYFLHRPQPGPVIAAGSWRQRPPRP